MAVYHHKQSPAFTITYTHKDCCMDMMMTHASFVQISLHMFHYPYPVVFDQYHIVSIGLLSSADTPDSVRALLPRFADGIKVPSNVDKPLACVYVTEPRKTWAHSSEYYFKCSTITTFYVL